MYGQLTVLPETAPADTTTAVGTPPIDVSGLDGSKGISVEVTGITTGTVQVQHRVGTVWVNEGSAVTADGVVHFAKHVKEVRGLVTVDTDVAVQVKAAGVGRSGAAI